ncbi:MAG: hypothetical protein K2Z80_23205 [Xanthobacteraceae bacterium]|nr:hypothetical protein [Xanthobacteraceae bacterium]
MTVNPFVSGLLAAVMLHEPVTLQLAAGLVAVCVGLWIATTEAATKSAPKA